MPQMLEWTDSFSADAHTTIVAVELPVHRRMLNEYVERSILLVSLLILASSPDDEAIATIIASLSAHFHQQLMQNQAHRAAPPPSSSAASFQALNFCIGLCAFAVEIHCNSIRSAAKHVIDQCLTMLERTITSGLQHRANSNARVLNAAICILLGLRLLSVTGVVLRLANQVYLRPEDVAEQVIQVRPAPLSVQLSPLQHASKYMNYPERPKSGGRVLHRAEDLSCESYSIAAEELARAMHGRPQGHLSGSAHAACLFNRSSE